jgi:hypothetical protein
MVFLSITLSRLSAFYLTVSSLLSVSLILILLPMATTYPIPSCHLQRAATSKFPPMAAHISLSSLATSSLLAAATSHPNDSRIGDQWRGASPPPASSPSLPPCSL